MFSLWKWNLALYLSNLTLNYLIYGSIPPNIISWTEPLISNLSDTIFIKTLTITDIQEQLLLTVSAEDFTDPTTRSKLTQLTKEKGI